MLTMIQILNPVRRAFRTPQIAHVFAIQVFRFPCDNSYLRTSSDRITHGAMISVSASFCAKYINENLFERVWLLDSALGR
jgi:hypothetical protein